VRGSGRWIIFSGLSFERPVCLLRYRRRVLGIRLTAISLWLISKVQCVRLYVRCTCLRYRNVYRHRVTVGFNYISSRRQWSRNVPKVKNRYFYRAILQTNHSTDLARCWSLFILVSSYAPYFPYTFRANGTNIEIEYASAIRDCIDHSSFCHFNQSGQGLLR